MKNEMHLPMSGETMCLKSLVTLCLVEENIKEGKRKKEKRRNKGTI